MVPAPPFHFGAARLSPVGDPTFGDWAAVGEQLRVMRDHSPWWAGDWWVYGEQRFGEMASQEAREELERETGSKYNTIRVAAWVVSHYPADARVEGASFRHHQEVAVLEPTVRDHLLREARDENWTIARLRHEATPYRPVRKARAADHDRPVIAIAEGDAFTVLPTLEQRFALLIADSLIGSDRLFDPDDSHVAAATGGLGGVFEYLATECHAFLLCSADDLPDLELELRSRGLPIQSRIAWYHDNHVTQHTTGGSQHAWSPILHIGTRPLCHGSGGHRARVDVQRFAAVERDGAYPTKPFDLVRWLITLGSKPGDTVLDLFGGDATTALACQELGRHCTVIERDPIVAAAIRQRVATTSPENFGSFTGVEA